MSEFGSRESIFSHALRQAIARVRSNSIAEYMGSSDRPARDSIAAGHAWVALGRATLAAGKITADESLLFQTFAVEAIHDRRWLDHKYPEIEGLSTQMREIERKAGLLPNEYWAKGDAPEEWQRLSAAYDEAFDARFEETLREFGLDDLALLWRTDRPEYNRRREVGRRSIFSKNDHLLAVTSVTQIYEGEAVKSANARAFYAATVMLGAAAEARLLARFLLLPGATALAYAELPRVLRPRNSDPRHWSLEHMLVVAEQAGWLGLVENEEVGVNVRSWLMTVRDVRNLLHPGRHVRDRPHVRVGADEYLDASLGYGALCIALVESAPSKQDA